MLLVLDTHNTIIPAQSAQGALNIATVEQGLNFYDCALVAHSLQHIQKLMDCFATAAKRFGLTISLKKTEVMLQPRLYRVVSHQTGSFC